MQRQILVVLVALSVALGAAAVTATDHANVNIDQQPGESATVTVTDSGGEPVENASLTVEPADDGQPDYDGTGNYTTDTNGTVALPAPNETVDIVVTATVDNETVSAEATLEAPPEPALTVEQTRGQPATVTVTADNETVESASVGVETVDENATYAGTNETYTTDENGTVELPAPEETVTVIVTAELDGASTATEAELEAAPTLDLWVDQEGPGLPATVTVLADGEAAENASINVSLVDVANVSYAGTGSYETDANGSIELPAPEETVEVAITASYQGAEETAVVTLAGIDAIDETLPFGQQLQQFKATLDGDDAGREIAAWVTDNNPGNAPDHAGPKDAEDDNGTDRGPPAHASRNDSGDESESAETEGDGEEESSDEGNDGAENRSSENESNENGSAGGDSNADSADGNSGNAGDNENSGGNGNGRGNGNAGNNGNR